MNQTRYKFAELPFFLVVIVVTGLVARGLSWPGFATHDTLFITREALEGSYTTYHPLLNALFIRLLAVPFDSYGLYTSLQILLCCTLLYQSFRHVLHGQANLWPARLTVLMWAVSVHTLLYLGIIWKDVPIAYALTFMAALVYRLRGDPGYRPAMFDAGLLAISLFLCLGLRHGMVFNTVLLPLLIGWRRMFVERRLWVPTGLAVVGFAVLQLLGATQLVQNDDSHMTKLKISAISQPFLGIITNKNGYTSDNYEYDRTLAERAFGKNYAEEYTPDYFRNNVIQSSPIELERAYSAILKRTPRLCASNFSLCVSARVQMFLGTLQPSTSFGGMTFYDLGSFEDCGKVFGLSEPHCRVLQEFETSEKIPAALGLQRELQVRLVESKGALVKLLAWNLLPALLLIVALLVFGTAFSPLWLVAVFFAVQLGLPFMTAMANDFRYYYFLAPFAVVFTPAALGDLLGAIQYRRVRLGGAR